MPRPDVLSKHILTLLQRHHLLSVQDLQKHLTAANLDYNKTSLYRSLERLQNNQSVCVHHFQDTVSYYELRDHHHDHFVCENCHAVEELPCQVHEHTTITVNGKPRSVTHHHATFYGLCETCQLKA